MIKKEFANYTRVGENNTYQALDQWSLQQIKVESVVKTLLPEFLSEQLNSTLNYNTFTYENKSPEAGPTNCNASSKRSIFIEIISNDYDLWQINWAKANT